MPGPAGRRNVRSVSSAAATTPTLASLSASRAQQQAALRWLRPLAPVVLVVVVLACFRAHPHPALAGYGLRVAIALGLFILAGLGVLATSRRSARVQIGAAVVLLAASAALMWLQPEGAGIAGIFVGVSRIVPLIRKHRSIPLTVVGLVVVAVLVAMAGHASVTTAVLNAITLGAFYGMFFLALSLGEANQLAEDLLVELEQSRAAEARAAGLAERQRLAREMHDVLAHSLSGLMLQLEGARMLAAADARDPRLPGAIERAHRLGKAGVDEARRAIEMLRDDELPGPDRLPTLATQFEQDQAIPCRLTVTGTAHDLSSEARLALYRVAQEGLTNITKHAHPVRVELRLAYEQATTRLTIEDFGSTPAPTPVDNGGYGLTGMRERAELLGGTLTTGPTPTGFRVELEVPA
jgi:signal transduction histidine kinase